jgi:hypothetical protein
VSSVVSGNLSGATVAIIDGANSGHSTQTNGNGEFRLEGLQAGSGTLSASASGYQEARRWVDIPGTAAVVFRLTPILTTVNESFTGSLSPGDGGCPGSGGTPNGKPCVRYPFTLYNNGTLFVRLTWSNSSTDLDLEYWRGASRRTSTGRDNNTETISTTISPGSYEVRVVYSSGAGSELHAADHADELTFMATRLRGPDPV